MTPPHAWSSWHAARDRQRLPRLGRWFCPAYPTPPPPRVVDEDLERIKALEVLDEDLERIKVLRLKAAATSAQADDAAGHGELRRRTQGHADEDLERIAALRRTAAAPSWTPEDDEELAALRLKAAVNRRRAGRKAPQERRTTVTPDGSFNRG